MNVIKEWERTIIGDRYLISQAAVTSLFLLAQVIVPFLLFPLHEVNKIYRGPGQELKVDMAALVAPRHGSSLEKAVESVTKAGPYGIGEVHLKKVPRGFSSESPRARFLLFAGLDAFIEMPVPCELFSGALVEFCMGHYLAMWPLHEWLLELMEREGENGGQK